MPFMTPEYLNRRAYRFDGPEGWRPFFASTPGDKMDADKLAEWLEFDAPGWFAGLMEEEESNVWSVERDESPMWYVRLSASGYMDATDWSGPYETEAEAQAYLRDSHDVDPETGESLSEETGHD
jgi:hypothetical protein